MKKLFIGLLIVAAGAGIFYYFNQRTCNKPPQDSLNKELLVGKWKSAIERSPKDSAPSNYQYEFQQAGIILRSLNDSSVADTLLYAWSNTNELVWKESPTDSTAKMYAVVLLTKDSLQLRSTDNSTTMFIKVK